MRRHKTGLISGKMNIRNGIAAGKCRRRRNGLRPEVELIRWITKSGKANLDRGNLFWN